MPQVFLKCSVQNCQFCATESNCSICAPGYLVNVTNGYCYKASCTIPYCALCLFGNATCITCNEGFALGPFEDECVNLNTNYTCSVEGCEFCQNGNPQVCDKCIDFFYQKSGSSCNRILCSISNCEFCSSNNTCAACISGYVRIISGTTSPPFSCIPSAPIIDCSGISNCFSCGVVNYTSVCLVCLPGLVYDMSSKTCVPQNCDIPYCQVCGTDVPLQHSCLICQAGFRLTSYLQCTSYIPIPLNVSCNVYNCFSCYEPNTCGFCLLGWTNTFTTNVTNGALTYGQCITNNTAYCNSNCNSCTNSTFCTSCVTNFLVNS